MLRIVYYDQNRIWAWAPLHAKEEKCGKQYMGDDEIAYSMILENSVIFDA